MFGMDHTIGIHEVRGKWKTAMLSNMRRRIQTFFDQDNLPLMMSIRTQQGRAEAFLKEKIMPCLAPISQLQLSTIKTGLAANVDQLVSMLTELQITLSAEDCTYAGCKGTVRNDICETCFYFKCEKCHLVHPFTDGCSEDTLKSETLIKAECRTCPGCKAPIQRISGCPQMLCTVCRTRFDYHSGKIFEKNESFHNPHLSDPEIQPRNNTNLSISLRRLAVNPKSENAKFLTNGFDLFTALNEPRIGIETSIANLRTKIISGNETLDNHMIPFFEKMKKLLEIRDGLNHILLPVFNEQTTPFHWEEREQLIIRLRNLGKNTSSRIVGTRGTFFATESFYY